MPVSRWITRAVRALLVPYAIGLFLVTWLPGERAGKVTGIVAETAHLLESLSIPFETGYPILEFLANVALFVPLGILLPLAWRTLPWWAVVAIGFATTVLIELVQLTMPSRYSTVSDVVANTLGTALGFALVQALAHLGRRPGVANVNANDSARTRR